LFELYTGNTLFQTRHNLEHLAMMEKSLGALPAVMVAAVYTSTAHPLMYVYE